MSSFSAGLGASILSPTPSQTEFERNEAASDVELNGESACRDPSPEEKGKDKVVYGEYLEDHRILLNRRIKFFFQQP